VVACPWTSEGRGRTGVAGAAGEDDGGVERRGKRWRRCIRTIVWCQHCRAHGVRPSTPTTSIPARRVVAFVAGRNAVRPTTRIAKSRVLPKRFLATQMVQGGAAEPIEVEGVGDEAPKGAPGPELAVVGVAAAGAGR